MFARSLFYLDVHSPTPSFEAIACRAGLARGIEPQHDARSECERAKRERNRSGAAGFVKGEKPGNLVKFPAIYRSGDSDLEEGRLWDALDPGGEVFGGEGLSRPQVLPYLEIPAVENENGEA